MSTGVVTKQDKKLQVSVNEHDSKYKWKRDQIGKTTNGIFMHLVWSVADPWGGGSEGDRLPPLEWSLKSFLVTSFPKLPIPGSRKFFPNYKFIIPGLFFDS